MNAISLAFVSGLFLGAATIMCCEDYREYKKITLPALAALISGTVLLGALLTQIWG